VKDSVNSVNLKREKMSKRHNSFDENAKELILNMTVKEGTKAITEITTSRKFMDSRSSSISSHAKVMLEVGSPIINKEVGVLNEDHIN